MKRSTRIAVLAVVIIGGVLVERSRAQEAEEPAEPPPVEVPRVVLSEGHAALCRVAVGDTMPAIELPVLENPRQRRRLRELYGKSATVVVFWSGDRRMALEQLADVGPDVIEPFADAGVAVVGVAVNESADSAPEALERADADFPNLLDAEGRAFAQVGSRKLPRTYLLDPDGQILWFDIEYSPATRRELRQALRAVADPSVRPLQRQPRTTSEVQRPARPRNPRNGR